MCVSRIVVNIANVNNWWIEYVCLCVSGTFYACSAQHSTECSTELVNGCESTEYAIAPCGAIPKAYSIYAHIQKCIRSHTHRHRHSVAHIKWMCIFCSLHCQPSVSLPHIFCSSMYSLYHISALNEFHLIAFSLHVFHRAEYIMNRTPKKSLTSLPTQRHRGKKIVTHIRDLVSYFHCM